MHLKNDGFVLKNDHFILQFEVSLLALDISAYRLDISAFAGLLNDGAAHTFSFDVVDGDPPKASGVWYIDPVLILQLDHDLHLGEAEAGPAGYSGAVDDSTCLSPAAAATRRVVQVDPEIGSTQASMQFAVSGTNTKPGEQMQRYTHNYTLAAQNHQPKDGPTEGTMSTLIATSNTKSDQVRLH